MSVAVLIKIEVHSAGIDGELTYAEAKELYEALHSLFGESVVYYRPLPYCQPSYPGVYPWTYTAGSPADDGGITTSDALANTGSTFGGRA